MLLLVLTTIDYALWNWSIANSHDITSLVAGLTLLPLAALSLGGLVILGARLMRFVLGSSSRRAHAHARTRRASATEHTTPASATEQSSSPSRLAA